jgi:hypothetical protein
MSNTESEKDIGASTEKDGQATKTSVLDKDIGPALGKFFGLLFLAFIVVTCTMNKIEEYGRTPAQVAAHNLEMRQRDLDKENKPLRENAEEIVRDYMLASTGGGYCVSLKNTSLANVRYGTAVYKFAKREPAITGSYSADCVYYVQGQEIIKRQTYWFRMTMQSSTGQREGSILLDNPQEIQRGLQQTLFQ